MGFAMSTFSIVSSLWGPWNTAAFMAHSFGESRRECIATRRPRALALHREALVERDADDSELLPFQGVPVPDQSISRAAFSPPSTAASAAAGRTPTRSVSLARS